MVFKNIFANQLIIHILILICTYVSFCRWEGPQRTETNEYTPFSQKALLFTMEHMWQLFQLNICVWCPLYDDLCKKNAFRFSTGPHYRRLTKNFRLTSSAPLFIFSKYYTVHKRVFKIVIFCNLFVTLLLGLSALDSTWLDSTWFDSTWIDLTLMPLILLLLKTSFGTQCNDGSILCNTLCVQITTTYVRFVESKSFSLSYGALDG